VGRRVPRALGDPLHLPGRAPPKVARDLPRRPGAPSAPCACAATRAWTCG
jgi:hypothetical protein